MPRTHDSGWRGLFRRQALPTDTGPGGPAITIRLARPEDEPALSRLAQLDSSRPPRGLVLLAEVDGALWAAASADDLHVVADPLRPSSDLVWRLLERGRRLRQVRRSGEGSFPLVWPRSLDPEPGLPAG
jgi:hypothetical protein